MPQQEKIALRSTALKVTKRISTPIFSEGCPAVVARWTSNLAVSIGQKERHQLGRGREVEKRGDTYKSNRSTT